ncbi:type I restriction enzyme S subunit [Azomonas agilis]|uniref:Type I restriction enzyme S subunit n=1 Tax=Azomonas agilis TaxID=116849 RepID=A0A562J229_9GAMM|nr:restriction endonuclease subunit S [Azomonas agilis]TWH77162.1 type I restriction enzyme S subunit [Azomonas agilis]
MSSKQEDKTLMPAEKQALVPKLRFPEFRKVGEWERKPLKSICVMQAGKFVAAADIFENSRYDLYPCYGGNGLRGYTKTHTHSGKYPLIGRQGALCGNVNLVNGQFHATEHAVVTTPKSEVNVDWLYYMLDLLNLNRFATGQAQPGLSVEVLDKVQSFVPQEPEQQKIADCLTSLDELITLEAQKLDTLKTHKKGLMQQLFPAEGKTVPKLRFPEFREASEWKKQRISSLLVRAVRPLSVKIEETYREIGIRSHGKGIFHKEPVLGKSLGDKRVFHVEESAFVLNIVFAWEQAVAVTSVAEKGMIASHRFPMYKPREHKSDVEFIKYFFLTCKGRELLGIASPGGAGRNKTLGQKEFEKLEFLSPEKVEEQTTIACCLSSIDDLIAVQTQKLDVLKTHKKGLLQQLFPALDEVQG